MNGNPIVNDFLHSPKNQERVLLPPSGANVEVQIPIDGPPMLLYLMDFFINIDEFDD